jgi:hypothetical protein
MYIKRTAYDYISDHLEAKEITLITGPRQEGKTTIMETIKSELDKKDEKKLFYKIYAGVRFNIIPGASL